jgi:hypothetical protein
LRCQGGGIDLRLGFFLARLRVVEEVVELRH